MIELRPPTDPDNYRVKTGRFGDRFYTDPLPADDTWTATTDDDVYPAISTVKKATGQDWSRAMAKRLAKDPRQLAEIARIGSEFERKERLNLLSDAGLDQASGRGTIVHQHAEAVLANRLPIYQMTDTVKPYIRTLEAFLAAYQPKLVAVEFVAIHRTLNAGNQRCQYAGYGGTGDAVVEIDGEWWLVDWKSRAEDSQHKAYPEEGAQVSGYGRAQYWIVGDDTSIHGAKRIEVPKLAGGLIVSIKPDSYECYPIDLDKGFEYWTDLHAWWQARRSETKAIGRKWAPRVAPTSQLVVIPADAVDDNGDEHPHAGCTMDTETGECLTPTGDLPESEKRMMDEHQVEVQRRQEMEQPKPPTVTSNRARFNALSDAEKIKARELFKRDGLNPNRTESAVRVASILTHLEQRPSLREMQEQRAEQIAEHGPTATERDRMIEEANAIIDPFVNEGGEATDEMVGEARLAFDMVIGSDGKAWTGIRVTEANDAGVPFRISDLRSMRRAWLYLALTRWATWRGGATLRRDEVEGNIEFASILFSIDQCEDGAVPLGHRLGMLTVEQAQAFATLVTEVVESETGDNLATEPETQPVTTSQK